MELNKEVLQSYTTIIQIARTVKQYDVAEQTAKQGIVVFTENLNNPAKNQAFASSSISRLNQELLNIEEARKTPVPNTP